MIRKRYTQTVVCRGGCGKQLVTGIRLGSARNRSKYAGWCEDCMTPEMERAMVTDGTLHMLKQASRMKA